MAEGDLINYDAPCPGCDRTMGEHTMRDYAECLEKAGFNYTRPHEEFAGGPMMMPGIEGHVVGECEVRSAVVEAKAGAVRVGWIPALRFVFTGAGEGPMERKALPTITLVLDAPQLKAFRTLVWNSTEAALRAWKRTNAGDN